MSAAPSPPRRTSKDDSSWRTPALAAGTLLGAFAASPTWAMASAPTVQELGRLSIEDLANIDVSSVSKTSQPLSDAPAAIYVITHEDAVRSGATNLAEILRLAPNLQVARVTANSYAISARGFNGTAADKLLVLIDGRSVYTPFSHGVYWDAQDTPAEIIERVEVISGPGATLWGANAVNGVINVVTRKAGADPGLAVQVGGGNLARRAGLQASGGLGEQAAYRVYLSGVDNDHSRTAAGANAKDGWQKWQGGFRVDWTPAGDLLTLQGDAYRGTEDQLASANQDIEGHNLLARWTHPTWGGGHLQIQAYYDYLHRDVPGRYSYRLRTYDLDVQHNFTSSAHEVVWGGGLRVTQDHFPVQPQGTVAQSFQPVGRTLSFGNLFVQDAMTVTPRVKLTLGLKLEDDAYSGVAALPSVRISWKVSDDVLLWGAVSRAVREPSRLDRDYVEYRRGVLTLKGGDFLPEKLNSYELGYRAQPDAHSSISVSAYYNVYDDLRSFEFTRGGLPVTFANRLEGKTWGLEAWGAYQVADGWRLSGGVNWLHKKLRFQSGSSRLGGVGIAGDDPDFQAQLRSSMDLGERFKLDVDLRHVSDLPAPASPAYTELGAKLRWALTPRLEVVFVGSNLLHRRHPEFGSDTANVQLGATGVETGRSFFVDTRWRF